MSLMAVDELRCQELVELVTDYLEGALAPDVVERFERHLLNCPFCDEYLAQIRRTIALTGRLHVDALDPKVGDELLYAFRRWRETKDDGASSDP